MKATRSVLCFVFLLAVMFGLAQSRRSQLPEQVEFSAEDEHVKDPVALPQDALALFADDREVKAALEDNKIPDNKIPSSWYSASAIHLSSLSRTDYVVVGNPPLAGANVTTFWVFRATDRGHELVLAAPAHNLSVKTTRTNGYRNIQLMAASAVQVHTVDLRFDGNKYSIYQDKWEDIK